MSVKGNVRQYVLTGAPGVGKTSTLLALEWHGETVVREVSTDYIALQQARGVAQPWLADDFQDRILERQRNRESQALLLPCRRVFLDRSQLDGWAYYLHDGKEVSVAMKHAIEQIRIEQPYSKVFLIKSFGLCESTVVRRENVEEALELEMLQEKNYRSLGFEVVSIGPGKVDELAREIIRYVEEDEA